MKEFSILKETFNIMTVVVEPLRQCHLSRVWKFYGDSEDGEFAHCLLFKYNPKATQVDGPEELKGDFCSHCLPVHLFLLNIRRKKDFMC